MRVHRQTATHSRTRAGPAVHHPPAALAPGQPTQPLGVLQSTPPGTDSAQPTAHTHTEHARTWALPATSRPPTATPPSRHGGWPARKSLSSAARRPIGCSGRAPSGAPGGMVAAHGSMGAGCVMLGVSQEVALTQFAQCRGTARAAGGAAGHWAGTKLVPCTRRQWVCRCGSDAAR